MLLEEREGDFKHSPAFKEIYFRIRQRHEATFRGQGREDAATPSLRGSKFSNWGTTNGVQTFTIWCDNNDLMSNFH